MTKVRQVFADFARLEDRPGLGLSVPLGREDLLPDLASLTEGERVLVVEPDNLCAEATATRVSRDDYHYWFGVLDSMAAIQDADPNMPAAQ